MPSCPYENSRYRRYVQKQQEKYVPRIEVAKNAPRSVYAELRRIQEFDPFVAGFPFACSHPVFGRFIEHQDISKYSLEDLAAKLMDTGMIPAEIIDPIKEQCANNKPMMVKSLLRVLENEYIDFILILLGDYSREKELHDDILARLQSHPVLFPAVRTFETQAAVNGGQRSSKADLLGYSYSDSPIIIIEVKHSQSSQDPARQIMEYYKKILDMLPMGPPNDSLRRKPLMMIFVSTTHLQILGAFCESTEQRIFYDSLACFSVQSIHSTVGTRQAIQSLLALNLALFDLSCTYDPEMNPHIHPDIPKHQEGAEVRLR